MNLVTTIRNFAMHMADLRAEILAVICFWMIGHFTATLILAPAPPLPPIPHFDYQPHHAHTPHNLSLGPPQQGVGYAGFGPTPGGPPHGHPSGPGAGGPPMGYPGPGGEQVTTTQVLFLLQ